MVTAKASIISCLFLLLCLSRKLIRMRKEEVVSAVIIIQRYFKTRFLKKRYLKVKYLTVWLQSRCRKVIAKLRVNRIVLSRLMSEGKKTLVCICMYVCMHVSNEMNFLRIAEKNQLLRLSNIEAENIRKTLFDSRVLGSGFIRSGSSKFERLLLAYDIHFDTTFSYPEGIVCIMNFLVTSLY